MVGVRKFIKRQGGLNYKRDSHQGIFNKNLTKHRTKQILG